MDLDEFQKEVNNLLFLYYNSIGVIQRDFLKEDIESTMESLLNDLKVCKAKIDFFLENKVEVKKIDENYEKIIKEGEMFVSDGLFLIDELTKGIE